MTGDVLARLLATCRTNSLRDTRDRAILMVAFASGGRRRSEIAGIRTEQLTAEAPIIVEDRPPLPSIAIHLGRTKTSGVNNDEVVYLTGRSVKALNACLMPPGSKAAACFGRLIAGETSHCERSIRRQSTTSSSIAPLWQAWSQQSFLPMDCAPGF